MKVRHLDLDAVQAFVFIAEFGSFTRAADAMRTTQSAVSSKLKRLEQHLDCRLIERTPRHVALSAEGQVFLPQARELLAAHDRAMASFSLAQQRVVIGISDHVAGPELPSLIARMNAQDPNLVIEIRLGSSGDLLQNYDRRELDAAILRLSMGREDGEVIAEEELFWLASPTWQHRAGMPLPVATLAEPCGVRVLAGQLLDEAEEPWTEMFVGGGVTAVSAAVMAGLGVSLLARRILPFGAVNVGPRLGLPEPPKLPLVLHSRITEGRAFDAVSALSAAYRSLAQK